MPCQILQPQLLIQHANPHSTSVERERKCNHSGRHPHSGDEAQRQYHRGADASMAEQRPPMSFLTSAFPSHSSASGWMESGSLHFHFTVGSKGSCGTSSKASLFRCRLIQKCSGITLINNGIPTMEASIVPKGLSPWAAASHPTPLPIPSSLHMQLHSRPSGRSHN